MSNDHEEIDDRLARLRRATDAVVPRADFAAHVAAGVAREVAPVVQVLDLWTPARRLLPVAALAAALGLVWAVQSAHVGRRGAGSTASATELDTQW